MRRRFAWAIIWLFFGLIASSLIFVVAIVEATIWREGGPGPSLILPASLALVTCLTWAVNEAGKP